LISITERISIDGIPISETDFARFTSQVKETAAALVETGRLQTLPTFFEHVTAIALLAFREAKIELGILETGLGGRLDSTTAARADIVAITPIALDHQDYLGHSLAEIAAEKAAIIRQGVTAIIALQDDAALQVILSQCQAVGVEPTFAAAQTIGICREGRCCATFKTSSDTYEGMLIGLRGRHQAANAAVAIALAEALRDRGFPISRQSIIEGIESARHAGRLEIWAGPPGILFDGAHNPAAAAALRAYLDEFVKEPIIMIFGAMRDKALDEIAAILFPRADAVILTALDNPRAASVDSLRAAVPDSFDEGRVWRSSTVDEALQLAKRITPASGLVCITGSLYLVGAAQHALKQLAMSRDGD
jgi:dihydrofolate synthase/folylpolyglutamate synthase